MRVLITYTALMKTDALSRRLRFAPPQPMEERLSLRSADFQMFEAINRHGPLPSTYLQRFAGHRDRSALQYRLTKLYNGSKLGAPLLARPPQQFQSFAARYQHLIYELTPTARALLRERGIEPIDRTDPFLHRFMGACVGASIELTAGELGLRYIPRTEVLARHGKALPVRFGGTMLIPDDLFGLEYTERSYRFFAVEIDRNTESIERKKSGYNTFAKKLAAYLDLMANKGFKDTWGVPNLLVLTVTTNETHCEHLVRHVDRYAGRFADRFLFTTRPDFGVNWRVPGVMAGFLHAPWTRTVAAFDIAQP